MNVGTCSAVAVLLLLVGLGTPARTAGAQMALADVGLQSPYDAPSASVEDWVVRIRTVAHLEPKSLYPGSASRLMLANPLILDGTAIVIGTMDVDGRREYVLLTCNHVVDATRLVEAALNQVTDGRWRERMEAPTIDSERTVLATAARPMNRLDVRLEVLAQDRTMDVAVLRTAGANRPLAVFPGRIGLPGGGVHRGVELVTSGYPIGEPKRTAHGLAEGPRLHELGGAHVDYVVDLPLAPGQSGSPVFVASDDGDEAGFALVGLLHAREGGRPLMVPATQWRSLLCGLPTDARESAGCANRASSPQTPSPTTSPSDESPCLSLTCAERSPPER